MGTQSLMCRLMFHINFSFLQFFISLPLARDCDFDIVWVCPPFAYNVIWSMCAVARRKALKT